MRVGVFLAWYAEGVFAGLAIWCTLGRYDAAEKHVAEKMMR